MILCYFNVVGVDLYGEIGEEYELESYFIFRVCLLVLNGKCSFFVYGLDYLMRDGMVI